MLKDKHVAMNSFKELRKMKSLRQIDAAQLMIEMNKYSVSYANTCLSPSSRCPLTSPPENPNLHMPGARRQGISIAFATRPP